MPHRHGTAGNARPRPAAGRGPLLRVPGCLAVDPGEHVAFFPAQVLAYPERAAPIPATYPDGAFRDDSISPTSRADSMRLEPPSVPGGFVRRLEAITSFGPLSPAGVFVGHHLPFSFSCAFFFPCLLLSPPFRLAGPGGLAQPVRWSRMVIVHVHVHGANVAQRA